MIRFDRIQFHIDNRIIKPVLPCKKLIWVKGNQETVLKTNQLYEIVTCDNKLIAFIIDMKYNIQIKQSATLPYTAKDIFYYQITIEYYDQHGNISKLISNIKRPQMLHYASLNLQNSINSVVQIKEINN